jgi:hypothetical protein
MTSAIERLKPTRRVNEIQLKLFAKTWTISQIQPNTPLKLENQVLVAIARQLN